MRSWVVVLSTVALAVPSVSAQTISISMTDPSGSFDLSSEAEAGVVVRSNWNNVPYTPNQNGTTTIGQVLVEADGEVTGLGLSYRAWDGRNANSIAGNDPNSRMMKGKGPSPFDSSSDPHPYAAIEITGCHEAVSDVYDVYIYIGAGIGFTSGSYGNMYLSGAGTFGNFPAGGQIFAQSGYRTLNSNFTGTGGVSVYDENVGFIRSGNRVAGNYVLFEAVTLDTLTITPQMFDSQSNFHGVSMVGIQLVSRELPGCPEEGDTHCESISVVSIDGPNALSRYEVELEIIASDESGDAITYELSLVGDNGFSRDVTLEDGSVQVSLAEGRYTATVSVDDDTFCSDQADDAVCSLEFDVPGEVVEVVELFRRGDADGDGVVAITDAVRILGFLFQGADAPECLDAADADNDRRLQLTDAVRVLGFLFQGTEPPPAPGPTECGEDPDADSPDDPLDCASYETCE
jgi:hypothetical protein